MPAAVRLRGLPGRAARHRRPRPLAAGARGHLRDRAPLPRRVERARDDVHDQRGRGHAHRPDAAQRRPGRPDPQAQGRPRHRADAARVADPARLRPGQALGEADDDRRRAGHHRHRRPRPAGAARTAAAGGQGRLAQRRVRGRRGRRAGLLDDLVPVVRRADRPRHAARPDRGQRRGGRGLGGPVQHHPRAAPRRRAALAADAAPDDRRGHRRHRRRAHHLAARGLRRRAQLGLPLLLAARRRPHPRLAGRGRLHRGGRPLAGLAAAHHRRRPRPDAGPVRRRRLPAGPRGHPRPPARLRRLAAGPDRQRRGRPDPARRARRGDGRAREGARGRRDAARRGLAAPARAGRGPGEALAGAGQRDLGDPRRAAGASPTPG